MEPTGVAASLAHSDCHWDQQHIKLGNVVVSSKIQEKRFHFHGISKIQHNWDQFREIPADSCHRIVGNEEKGQDPSASQDQGEGTAWLGGGQRGPWQVPVLLSARGVEDLSPYSHVAGDRMLRKQEAACTGGSDSKDSICSAGDLGLIPALRRSPGGGHGNPLQYSCLENPMDRGAWRSIVHGVTKSWTQLTNYAQHSLNWGQQVPAQHRVQPRAEDRPVSLTQGLPAGAPPPPHCWSSTSASCPQQYFLHFHREMWFHPARGNNPTSHWFLFLSDKPEIFGHTTAFLGNPLEILILYRPRHLPIEITK